MGRFKLATFIIAGLFISQLAAAQVHHDNYDEADLDLLAVAYYLEEAFDLLNFTISNVKDIEIEKARSSSSNFSLMLTNARETLQSLPTDVDSYDLLNGSIESLGNTEKDLETMINGLELSLGSIDDLVSYDFDVWTERSIRENLSMANRGFTTLPRGLSTISDAKSSLVQDIEHFNSFNIEGSWSEIKEVHLDTNRIIDGLNSVDKTIELLEKNMTTSERIVARLMERPIIDLGDGLYDLLDETEPADDLSTKISIIKSSNHNLSSSLSHPIEVNEKHLMNGSRSIGLFSSSQMVFLKFITSLESNDTNPLSQDIRSLDICLKQIDNMTSYHESLEIVSDNLLYHDTGRISSAVVKIGELIDSYRVRLEALNIWSPDLQRMIGDLDSVMWSNLLDVDTDENGKLSSVEIGTMDGSQLPFALLDLLRQEITNITEQLKEVPSDYFEDLARELPHINSTFQPVNDFNRIHFQLIGDLKGLKDYATRNVEPRKMVVEAFLKISRLEVNLDGVLSNGRELKSHGFDFNADWEVPIRDLLEMYKSYLLLKKEAIEEPFIVISIDREILPFGTYLGYTVIAVDIDPVGGPFLPDGRYVNLTLDGEQIERRKLSRGILRGSIHMSSDLSKGIHGLNVSMRTVNETVVSSKVQFNLRKIFTVIVPDPASQSIALGNDASVHLEVRDEFFNVLEVQVLLNETGEQIETPGSVFFGELDLGENPFMIFFEGNATLDGTRRNVLIDVLQNPVMKISSNGTLFGRNDTIHLQLDLLLGNGSVQLFIDEKGGDRYRMAEGDSLNWTVDPTEIGSGLHLFRVFLRATDGLTNDGWSDPMQIEVNLSLNHSWQAENEGNEEDQNQGDNGNLPIVDNGDEPFNEGDDPFEEDDPSFWEDPPGPFTAEQIQWSLFILALLILAISALFLFLRKRKMKGQFKEPEKEKFHLPKIYIRPDNRSEDEEEEDESIPDQPSSAPEKDRGINMTREELIGYYLDLIESSPEELSIEKSMTPREVSMELRRSGLSKDIADRIALDFEYSIYKMGTPGNEIITRYREDSNRVVSWFSSLMDRIGITGNEGEDAL